MLAGPSACTTAVSTLSAWTSSQRRRRDGSIHERHLDAHWCVIAFLSGYFVRSRRQRRKKFRTIAAESSSMSTLSPRERDRSFDGLMRWPICLADIARRTRSAGKTNVEWMTPSLFETSSGFRGFSWSPSIVSQ
jgi:hypothetical protein